LRRFDLSQCLYEGKIEDNKYSHPKMLDKFPIEQAKRLSVVKELSIRSTIGQRRGKQAQLNIKGDAFI
jgi:hypothetical protein